MAHGYPWLDTLAHEMTHLALSQGTRDRAPLWLQEGVAKREETRWRDPSPSTTCPPPTPSRSWAWRRASAARSTSSARRSRCCRPPRRPRSPSPRCTSFIRFWTKEVGDDGLPRLVDPPQDALPARRRRQGDPRRERRRPRRLGQALARPPRRRLPRAAARPRARRRRPPRCRRSPSASASASCSTRAVTTRRPRSSSQRAQALRARRRDRALLARRRAARDGRPGERRDAGREGRGRAQPLRALVVAARAAPPGAGRGDRSPSGSGSRSIRSTADVGCEEKAAPELPADPIRRGDLRGREASAAVRGPSPR